MFVPATSAFWVQFRSHEKLKIAVCEQCRSVYKSAQIDAHQMVPTMDCSPVVVVSPATRADRVRFLSDVNGIQSSPHEVRGGV
ncbi:unnamed protein product [Nippostrongylus brasiliensis]|uniref:Uncharacterized protein n=1 Tax=Nippostrongylus brasiliensis TaxID=27835 RepID=A0A0N4YZ11_NIPBR|nr:unnamed protein product [Nippostrongylus brasiliensis]